MSSCQRDVKCQKVKHLDYRGGLQKKIDTMRFTANDVNFDITYEGHHNWSKYFYGHFECFWWILNVICWPAWLLADTGESSHNVLWGSI